ncbi:LLM class F420-dependent oxidoreductase [Nonomuraea typhae]|uniref:LLM class F420-dependent oxidoreductase n=1 Tax=Nonomuraea typhae TaxID=2603600 RepID=UPI0012FA7DB6|nr:LLM class F420-dependent oxidoreductase [Nonomuraea typhae]
MRIGLFLNEPRGDDPIGELRENLAAAAADGFPSAWVSNIFGLDALTALAATGDAAPGLELGTAVVPTYPRHPAVLAQQAMTANAALGGRLTLGIGLSHQIVVENMYGYSYDKPARHMREYLAALIPLVKEGEVTFQGETIKADVRLRTPGRGLPVLIAALAPRMLHLAGAVADGTVLWMTGPKTVTGHVAPAVTAAAEEAGRPRPRIVCGLPVCVTDDPAAARERADEVFSVYGQLPSYRAMLDKEGAGGPGGVAIVGDEDSVRAQIQELADAGVTDFIASEYSKRERTRQFLKGLVE